MAWQRVLVWSRHLVEPPVVDTEADGTVLLLYQHWRTRPGRLWLNDHSLLPHLVHSALIKSRSAHAIRRIGNAMGCADLVSTRCSHRCVLPTWCWSVHTCRHCHNITFSCRTAAGGQSPAPGRDRILRVHVAPSLCPSAVVPPSHSPSPTFSLPHRTAPASPRDYPPPHWAARRHDCIAKHMALASLPASLSVRHAPQLRRRARR